MKKPLHFLDAIFRHPAFVALISVSVGTWLFGYFSYVRSREDARREKAVTFLEETSKPINAVMSELFRYTRGRRELDDSLKESVSGLFQQRFAVKIKSQAFLG